MKLLIIFCLLIIICGCNGNSTESTLENSKLFIKYPVGWDIIEEEEIKDIGYFIEIEKESVPGTKLMVGWIEEIELIDLLKSVQVSLESKMSYVNSNLTFEIATDWGTPEEEKILQAFYFEQLGESFHGLIRCYRQNGKAIVILKQEAFADRYLNMPDFDLMEKSLLIF